MNKYDTNPSENEVLPNKLGLIDPNRINVEEATGFANARDAAIDAFGADTVFSLQYLYDLHRLALGELYDFAGRLRTVNMEKGGFMFAAAHVLPQIMHSFKDEYLDPINMREWESDDTLRDFLGEMHAELLYIHPFREGNRRVARLFTSLIFLAKRGKELDFEVITRGNNLARYITAVQQAANKEYSLMRELFREAQA